MTNENDIDAAKTFFSEKKEVKTVIQSDPKDKEKIASLERQLKQV